MKVLGAAFWMEIGRGFATVSKRFPLATLSSFGCALSFSILIGENFGNENWLRLGTTLGFGISIFILISFVFNSSPLAAYNIRMSEYIHKRHNVTVLLYHLVFPAKYRRAVVDGNVDETIRDVCLKIEDRYQLKFLEIGTDEESIRSYVQNQAFIGALAFEQIKRLELGKTEVLSEEVMFTGIGRVRDIKTGPEGVLYVVLNNPNAVVRLTPVSQ